MDVVWPQSNWFQARSSDLNRTGKESQPCHSRAGESLGLQICAESSLGPDLSVLLARAPVESVLNPWVPLRSQDFVQ